MPEIDLYGMSMLHEMRREVCPRSCKNKPARWAWSGKHSLEVDGSKKSVVGAVSSSSMKRGAQIMKPQLALYIRGL